MFKAVLFDMNGVLVDSEGINILAWEKLFQEYGLEFSLDLYSKQIDGKSTKEVAKEYGIVEADKFVEKKDNIWFSLYADQGIKVFDDVPTNLRKLKERGVMLGITSSSRKADIILKDLDLINYFDVIIDSKLLKRGKPFPDIYIEAMRLLNVKPIETVAVEDSEAGAYAAATAQIACYKLCRNGCIDNKADYYIKSLDEIWKGWL